MKTNNLVAISIILISFIVGIYLYPMMPEVMASHWNFKGEVDDYMSKFWGLFLMPIMSLGMFLIFSLIPKMDPMKENIEKFKKYFDDFIVVLFLFLFYIYLLTIFWNLGLEFNMSKFLVPLMGILFFYCGNLIENAKRNWFIGIRTPWTLSNDQVWDKTHKRGGKLFKVCGIITFLSILLPDYAIFFTIIPIIFSSIYLFAYSYLEFQKLK
jgi:uncharacterized membrane protein